MPITDGKTVFVIVIILVDVTATVDSESSEEEDEEVQRKLAASLESVKESSEMTGGDNKDANVAGNLQETTSLEFEKLRIWWQGKLVRSEM